MDASTITPESRLVEDLKADSANVMVMILELESEFGITRSTASRVLRLMEQKGLVERQSVPHDARLKKLVLTERSRRLVQEMCQTGMTIDTRLLRGFSSDEVQTLYGFLDRMFRNLE